MKGRKGEREKAWGQRRKTENGSGNRRVADVRRERGKEEGTTTAEKYARR